MDWEQVKQIEFAIHGGIGGLIRVMLGQEKSLKRALVTTLSGACCAQYLTPLLENKIDFALGTESSGYGLSFVIGYLALILLSRLSHYVEKSSFGALMKQKK